MPRLTKQRLCEGVDLLCRRDRDLLRLFKQYGYPPLFKRNPGFQTLLLIILEQQVSLASARRAYEKLCVQLGGEDQLLPDNSRLWDDATLKAAGFSRQKMRYARAAATAINSGELELDDLKRLPDEAAREKLTAVTGIGVWTANIYLLMAMSRTDIWPLGDIALQEAIKQAKRLQARPTGDAFVRWGERWRPYRSVAAHILWHSYLSSR